MRKSKWLCVIDMKYTKYILIVLISGCAASKAPVSIKPHTSEEEVAVDVDIDEEQEVIVDGSAGGHLGQAFKFFETEQWIFSISSFRAALMTGNLNDAGRAISYWHISLAFIELGEDDKSLESLASFIVIGQDILDAREALVRYAITEDGDFVERFGLPNKLAIARAITNYEWASRSDYYGRSRETAVIAHNKTELDHFAAVIRNSCDGECDFERAMLRNKDGTTVSPYTEMMTLRGQDTEQFFIVIAE